MPEIRIYFKKEHDPHDRQNEIAACIERLEGFEITSIELERRIGANGYEMVRHHNSDPSFENLRKAQSAVITYRSKIVY